MYFEIENGIIEKAASGDIGSFEKIVALSEKSIYNICFRYFNDEEEAKDIAQETFIKIFRNIKRYNYKCKFSTWAYKIAVNSCIDQLRRMNSRPQTGEIDDNIYSSASTSPTPEETAITNDMLNDIENAIKKLPDDYKTAIILRDINELSYQEISVITNLSIGTVKSRISRSRQLLKQILINDFDIHR